MQADKTKISTLLKTAKGQIEGLLKMVEEDRDCVDISTQLLAVQSIIKKVNIEILNAHLQCCVKKTFESGNDFEKQETIKEVLNLISKITK
jgi:DNA-binding FrmR family transcriptional regulator